MKTDPDHKQRHFAPIAGPGDDAQASDWTSLRILNSYRLFIAIALVAAFLAGSDLIDFGATAPLLFYAVSATYLLTALLFALTIRLRSPSASAQAQLHLYIDILALSAATYASGGVTSGLGILLVVPVAGAGTLLPARHALLAAASASLLVLGMEVLRHLGIGAVATAYPQAALLGITLFVAALLAAALAHRSRRSADLARRRSADVKHLAALNERIVQQMESGILVVGTDGTIALANASAAVLLDQSSRLVGRDLNTLAPGLMAPLETWTLQGQSPNEPLKPHPEASRRLHTQFTSLGEAGTLLSLEDAAFIEEQVQQLKLASLGRLTASIAHEIRNPLAAISHSAQLLAESGSRGDHDQRLTRIMLSHCSRVNDIVENVLQLSRRQQGVRAPLELGEWAAEFVDDFTHHQSPETRPLEFQDPDHAIRILFDRSQLEQIVRNLCDNSLQHGKRPDGGRVTVTLATGITNAGQPWLDVGDDGVAIDAERVDELFEPFFTTSHSGTGLGLFLARELCQANGAQLRYVRPESGNLFRLTFEAAGEDAAETDDPDDPGARQHD